MPFRRRQWSIKKLLFSVAWFWLVTGLFCLVGTGWFAFQLPKAWALDHSEGVHGTITFETIKCLGPLERSDRFSQSEPDCTLTGTFRSDGNSNDQRAVIDADYDEYKVGDQLRQQYLDGTYRDIEESRVGVFVAGGTSIVLFAAALYSFRSFWRSFNRWRTNSAADE